MLGEIAINKLLKEYQFNSVLDVGSGQGLHSEIFNKYGKNVTAIDIGSSNYFKKTVEYTSNITLIKEDFNTVDFKDSKFDLVWACHILEHQKNVGLFLEKIKNICCDNGIICVTVPKMKNNIVGGHLTLWNAGLLLYNLILTGLDCSKAKIKTYSYNISVIINKKEFILPNNLSYDIGDIEKLSKYFPDNFNYHGFNGNIDELNW